MIRPPRGDWAFISRSASRVRSGLGLEKKAMGLAIGTPLGISAGTWLAEYGAASRAAMVVRFVNDILLSAPSIVIGFNRDVAWTFTNTGADVMDFWEERVDDAAHQSLQLRPLLR